MRVSIVHLEMVVISMAVFIVVMRVSGVVKGVLIVNRGGVNSE